MEQKHRIIIWTMQISILSIGLNKWTNQFTITNHLQPLGTNFHVILRTIFPLIPINSNSHGPKQLVNKCNETKLNKSRFRFHNPKFTGSCWWCEFANKSGLIRTARKRQPMVGRKRWQQMWIAPQWIFIEGGVHMFAPYSLLPQLCANIESL